MDLNATLLGQMITFGIFVWFTMKFVWPPLEKALSDRQKKISEGLAAAERGHKELALAQADTLKQLRESRRQASEMVAHAQTQAEGLIEEAVREALRLRTTLVESGRQEVLQETARAQEALQKETAGIAIAIAEKILQRTLSDTDHQKFSTLTSPEGS